MSGTQIQYYFICHRKLWLFRHSIDQEHNSEDVALGRHIAENTYKREKKEIQIEGFVIDHFDAKTGTVHEVKKSDKMDELHEWQLKFYMMKMKENGIAVKKGQIDYPKLKKTITIHLKEEDIHKLKETENNILRIIELETPPSVINKPFCKKCAYYELCYI